MFFLFSLILFYSCGNIDKKDYEAVKKIFKDNDRIFDDEIFNKITQIENRRVVSLDLSEKKLTVIPEEIGQLQELIELQIKKNDIDTLPESICSLKNLETLILSGNKLQILPENFGKLTGLKKLEITNNYIRKLPESFENLINLEWFEFDNLETLPDGFSNLKKLWCVSCAYDYTKNIPFQLWENRNIKDLLITNNSTDALGEMPEEIGNLTNLETLYFEGCYTKLPDSIGDLRNLKSLNLIGNFDKIPETVCGMVKLQSMRIKSKPLITIPSELYELMNLEILYLLDNKLEYLPYGISKLKKLRILDLDNNDLTALPLDIFETSHWKKEDGFLLSIKGNKICNVTKEQYEWLKEYINPDWRKSQRCQP